MSELTLKEAIEHLDDELNNPEHKWECSQCKKENEQVLKWLKELIKKQELESENSALLEENKDLYFELALAEKQYKELIECLKQYKKVLKIIFEKNVDIVYLKDSNNVEEYNNHFGCVICKLTEEEFNLLKRWVKNGNS